MKIRTSFVSNSSSSSFIIAIDKSIKTKDQLKEYMFPNSYYDDIATDLDYYDEQLDVATVINRVFNDLKETKKLTKEGIIEEIAYDGYNTSDILIEAEKQRDEELKSFENKHNLKSIYWSSEDKEVESKRKKLIKSWDKKMDLLYKQEAKKTYEKKLKEQFAGKNVFILSYSDNDGVESALCEHGNIFRNIPHIRISNH